ncbi:MAG: PmoA family protein [Pirellulales bacterium]|nr:PmoA family protein [Pirellulales bacterium]
MRRTVQARVLLWTLVVLAAGANALRAADATSPAVSFDQHDDRLSIRIGDRQVAEYRWQDPEISRPYLCDVYTTGGFRVTRNHPPVAGQDPTDHDKFHPGIWLAFGDLSGADSWRNKAAIRQLEISEPPRVDSGVGAFEVRQEYRNAAGDQVLAEEACRREIRVRAEGWLLVWNSTFKPRGSEIVFGDQEELGLGVRLATPLAVKQGGRIVNSDGLENEAQAWGKQADWCEYSGEFQGRRVGVLLMPDPNNFRRSWFHARDYGFIAANPFGRAAFTGGEPSRVVVRSGEAFSLRYAVLIFDEDPAQPFDRARVFRDVVKSWSGR